MEELKLWAETVAGRLSGWWDARSNALHAAALRLRDGQAQPDDYILMGAAILLACVLALLAFASIRRLAARNGFEPTVALSSRTRGPKWFGYAVALLFFGVFGGWAAYAPLSGAALANGVVNPDGRRKTVQHLEGGIIRSIHVREGERVAAGDVLVTLDTLRARARLEEVRERMVHLLATRARLEAELVRADTVSFPLKEISQLSSESDVAIAAQRHAVPQPRPRATLGNPLAPLVGTTRWHHPLAPFPIRFSGS